MTALSLTFQGYNSSQEYIATQGPLPETRNDFWKMVLQQKSQIIVMLTQCNEKRRVSAYGTVPTQQEGPHQHRREWSAYPHRTCSCFLFHLTVSSTLFQTQVLSFSLKEHRLHASPACLFEPVVWFPPQVKCDHYWPFTEEPITYGDITVEMISEEEQDDWACRHFRIIYVSHEAQVQMLSPG